MPKITEILYVHVPFCMAKCDYCAFHSTNGVHPDRVHAYLSRLDAELAERADDCSPLRRIFIGGGTPSALPSAALSRLLGMLGEHFEIAEDVEFTVECNPGTLSLDKIDVLQNGGVNRVSLGVQSFNDRIRSIIGRRGSVGDLERGLDYALAAFDNVNVDLIFGIPGQTLTEWQSDLSTLVDLDVRHISTYALGIEPDTPLGKQGLHAVDEMAYLEFWDMTERELNAAGYDRYEISNFSKPGWECKHNDDVWHGHRFAAAGPAAHGYDGHRRYANPMLDEWLADVPPVIDELTTEEHAIELFIIGLRTTVGWNLNAFHELTGVDIRELRGGVIESLRRSGLLTTDGEMVKPTKRGLLLNDWLGGELI